MKQKIQFILFISLSSFNLFANELTETDIANLDAIAEGGRLYDQWWKELKVDEPGTTHSSYPANAKKKGSASWRCKECHGWDYKGFKGAYATGSHKTGIKGVQAAKNMSIEDIVEILKDKTHGYNSVMPETALTQLANFVKNGQVDIATYLDKKTLLANGNKKRGKEFFTKNCKECHGNNGKNINFKTPLNPEFLGTVATENPVETIHKFRNGNPSAFYKGKRMPNMNKVLNLEEQIDLLSYLQTLPVK
ncbi:MAG: cytochrome c [Gammaproteobacteria bacterium]|nr:cytochrome c [Gammaproteobacteria bacterium]MCW9031443.1 cytochrome c [Gammaproteobacteria bacterium]